MTNGSGEDAARTIDELRTWRTRPERDLGIASAILDLRKRSQRTHRRLGDLIDLWRAIVPPRLADHTRIASYRAGVLHVVVDSTAAQFELDRALREGLEAALRSRFRGTLVSVRPAAGRAGVSLSLEP